MGENPNSSAKQSNSVLEGELVVPVQFGESVKHVVVDMPVTFELLMQAAAARFHVGEAAREELGCFYVDGDGDRITVSCDGDVDEALRSLSGRAVPLQLAPKGVAAPPMVHGIRPPALANLGAPHPHAQARTAPPSGAKSDSKDKEKQWLEHANALLEESADAVREAVRDVAGALRPLGEQTGDAMRELWAQISGSRHGSAPTQPPSPAEQAALDQLATMGFSEQPTTLLALRACHGDIGRTVDKLLAVKSKPSNPSVPKDDSSPKSESIISMEKDDVEKN